MNILQSLQPVKIHFITSCLEKKTKHPKIWKKKHHCFYITYFWFAKTTNLQCLQMTVMDDSEDPTGRLIDRKNPTHHPQLGSSQIKSP